MNVELLEASQAVYLEQLCELTQKGLSDACSRTIREWDRPAMMPPIAFILARVPARNFQLAAEQDWDLLNEIMTHQWHPDVGFYGGGRASITAAMDYALRQVGGMLAIHRPLEEDAPFVRKNFIEAHKRYNSEGGAQTRFTQELAENMLKQLTARQQDRLQ